MRAQTPANNDHSMCHASLRLGILYYLSATVNPVLYNIMSKRYRNGFKRTLCRWTIPTPSTSYRNFRSNGINIHNHHAGAMSPTLACTNNLHHPRSSFPKPSKSTASLPRRRHRRENLFTFSMSKYKFVIGSRSLAERRSCPVETNRRTSPQYRFSVTDPHERDEQQRRLSSHYPQSARKPRPKLIFVNAAATTPPLLHASHSDAKAVTTLPNGNHTTT